MLFTRFADRLSALSVKSRYMEWLCIGLVLVILMQWLYIIRKDERILLLPPDIQQPIPVYRHNVSREYLEAMGYWYAGLALNVTPAVANYQKELFLRFASPSSYHSLQVDIDKMFDYVRRNSISTLFSPRSITTDLRTKSVVIEGTLETWVADKKAGSRTAKYVIQFEPKNGCLYVAKFEEVDSNNPTDR